MSGLRSQAKDHKPLKKDGFFLDQGFLHKISMAVEYLPLYVHVRGFLLRGVVYLANETELPNSLGSALAI